MSNRPPIPNEIKRSVRQRCGFGCVICGFPLYEYEHMEEWAIVQRHEADEITLLCREHHGMKTGGLLPVEDVKSANQNPYNQRSDVSKHVLLRYSGRNFTFKIGQSSFQYTGLGNGSFVAPLVIDEMIILGLRVEDDKLLISFTAFDVFNKPIVSIKDNELVYDTNQWDIEWTAQTLTLREGKGRILLKLKFEPPGMIHVVQGRILVNGIEILVNNEIMFITNNCSSLSLRGTNCGYGLIIGRQIPGVATIVSVPTLDRYNVDRKEALKHYRKATQRFRREQP